MIAASSRVQQKTGHPQTVEKGKTPFLFNNPKDRLLHFLRCISPKIVDIPHFILAQCRELSKSENAFPESKEDKKNFLFHMISEQVLDCAFEAYQELISRVVLPPLQQDPKTNIDPVACYTSSEFLFTLRTDFWKGNNLFMGLDQKVVETSEYGTETAADYLTRALRLTERKISCLFTQFLLEGLHSWLCGLPQPILPVLLSAVGVEKGRELDEACAGLGEDAINILVQLVFPLSGNTDLLPLLHTEDDLHNSKESPRTISAKTKRPAPTKCKSSKQPTKKSTPNIKDVNRETKSPIPSCTEKNVSFVVEIPRDLLTDATKSIPNEVPNEEDPTSKIPPKIKVSKSEKTKTKNLPSPHENNYGKVLLESERPKEKTKYTESGHDKTGKIENGKITKNSNNQISKPHLSSTQQKDRLSRCPTQMTRAQITALRRPIGRGISEFELMNHYWVEELKEYARKHRIPKSCQQKKSSMIRAILKHTKEQ